MDWRRWGWSAWSTLVVLCLEDGGRCTSPYSHHPATSLPSWNACTNLILQQGTEIHSNPFAGTTARSMRARISNVTYCEGYKVPLLALRGGMAGRASRGRLGETMRVLRRETAKAQKYLDEKTRVRDKLVSDNAETAKIEALDASMQTRLAAEMELERERDGSDDGSPPPPSMAWPHVEGGQIIEVDEIDRSKDGVVMKIPIQSSKDDPETREDVIKNSIIPFSPIAPVEDQIQRALVPRLNWGDRISSPENASKLLHSLPQWIGESKSRELDRMVAEAEERGAIDVHARTEELFAQLEGEVEGEGAGSLPQQQNFRQICEVLAKREDTTGRARAVAEMEKVLREDEGEEPGKPPEEEEYAWWGDVGDDELKVGEDSQVMRSAPGVTEMFGVGEGAEEIGEERRDQFGKVLPDGITKVHPIRLAEETFEKDPELLDKLKSGELELWDADDIKSYEEVVEERREEQEKASILLKYLTTIAQVYDEEGAIDKAEYFWRLIEDVRRETGLDAKSEQERRIEKEHDEFTHDVLNVVQRAKEVEQDKDAKLDQEWEEIKAGAPRADVGEIDLDWVPPTAATAAMALPAAGEKLRLKGPREDKETLFEGSDEELREWFGDPDRTDFTPNVVRTEDGGIFLKHLGMGGPTRPRYPGMREAARQIHRSKEKLRAFVNRNIREVHDARNAMACQGRLMAWGGNFCGQLAIERNEVDQPSPVSCPPFHDRAPLHGRISAVSAGPYHTFISVSNPPQLLACGWNRFGQLGLGFRPLGEDVYPAEFDPDNATETEAAECADIIGDDWKEFLTEVKDAVGTLVLDNRNVNKPVEVVEGLRGKVVLSAECGITHSLLLVETNDDADGGCDVEMVTGEGRRRRQVMACGMNDGGQLGFGYKSKIPFRTFQVVEALAGERVLQIQAGWDFSVALLDSGAVVSWGWGAHGQLGQGGSADEEILVSPAPQAMVGLGLRIDEEWRAKAVACGDTHTMIVLEQGGLLACGLNERGQLGLGDYKNRAVPTEVPFFKGCRLISKVACGGDHTMVLLEDGRLFGFGKCHDGQIGTIRCVETEKVVYALPQLCRVYSEHSKTTEAVREVVCGMDHTLVVAASGQVYVMGSSCNGQTGLGNHGNALLPLEIPGIAGRTVQVAAGGYHSFAWGCGTDIRNQLWRVHNVLTTDWQHQELLLHRIEKEINGTGPPLPLWGFEFAGAPEWPVPLEAKDTPGDSRYNEYDVRAARNNEYDPDHYQEVTGDAANPNQEYDMADLQWSSLRRASFVERVRWRHGMTWDPKAVNTSVLHGPEDEFPPESASYDDEFERQHARGLVTDYATEPTAFGPWYMKEVLHGEEEVDKEVCPDPDW